MSDDARVMETVQLGDDCLGRPAVARVFDDGDIIIATAEEGDSPIHDPNEALVLEPHQLAVLRETIARYGGGE